jgi:hypothetical protein
MSRLHGRFENLSHLGSMIGTVLTLLGAVVGVFGVLVRVAPGLDRPKRRVLYKYLPITRKLFQLCESIEKGDTPNEVRHRGVIREFLDLVDETLPQDLPDRMVVAVTPYAADIKVHFPDGDTHSYPLGRPSHDVFQTIVLEAIQSKCKWWGLGIAVIGGTVTVIGILLSL